MKIILVWMCVATICFCAMGYITIREILISVFCAILLTLGLALIWVGHAVAPSAWALAEGGACIAVAVLTLYWASSHPGEADRGGDEARQNLPPPQLTRS